MAWAALWPHQIAGRAKDVGDIGSAGAHLYEVAADGTNNTPSQGRNRAFQIVDLSRAFGYPFLPSVFGTVGG